jgi:hypothetical protein
MEEMMSFGERMLGSLTGQKTVTGQYLSGASPSGRYMNPIYMVYISFISFIAGLVLGLVIGVFSAIQGCIKALREHMQKDHYGKPIKKWGKGVYGKTV